DQFGGAEGAFAQLLSHLGRHLQLTSNPPLWADGQRGSIAVLPQHHRPGVISNGRMRLELMEFFRVPTISRADPCNGVDHMLSGQARFIPNQAIPCVMGVVFAMQVSLKSKLGKSITGAVELFHRGFQLFRRIFGYDQLRLYIQMNTHLISIAIECANDNGAAIPLHLNAKRVVGGVSSPKKDEKYIGSDILVVKSLPFIISASPFSAPQTQRRKNVPLKLKSE